MVKIRKEEVERTINAFMKELLVMLKAFDKDAEAELVGKIYEDKKEVMINDTEEYLREVEHIEIL